MRPADGMYIIEIVYGSGAILSFLGALFIIFTYIAFKDFRTLTTLLIFFLGISDAGLALSDLLVWFSVFPNWASKEVRDVLCLIQAGGIQYFALSSFLWTSCIAFHAHGSLNRKKSNDTLRSYLKFYFIICFVLPIIPLIVGYKISMFGSTEGWCWIVRTKNWERFGFYYVPLVLMWLFNLAIYILLSRTDSLSYMYIINQGRKRLRLYLLVLILCKLPALINRILNLIYPDSTFFAPLLIQAIFDSMFGFLDSLVYGVTKTRVDIIKEKMCRCCPSSNKDKQLGLHDPLIQRESFATVQIPYNSITERMYTRKQGVPVSNGDFTPQPSV